MEKLKDKIFKHLFPKEYRALKEAIKLSWLYYEKSPYDEENRIGKDIYMRLIQILDK